MGNWYSYGNQQVSINKWLRIQSKIFPPSFLLQIAVLLTFLENRKDSGEFPSKAMEGNAKKKHYENLKRFADFSQS